MVLLHEPLRLGEVRVLGLSAARDLLDLLEREREVADELRVEERARHARALERLGDELLPVEREAHRAAEVRMAEGRLLRVHVEEVDRVDGRLIDIDVGPGARELVRLRLLHRRPGVPQHDASGLGRGELGRPADEDVLPHTVEVRQATDEIVLVPRPLDEVPALIALEPERPGADLGVGCVQVAVLLEDVLGGDATPRRGEVAKERGGGELQPELDRVGVLHLHGRHHRLERGAALGTLEVGVEDPVEARLDVGRAEGLAVVPRDALS